MPAEFYKSNIAITTGDPEGIGQEVTYKALSKIHSSKSRFFIFQPPKRKQLKCWPALPSEATLSVDSFDDAKDVLVAKNSKVQYIEICSKNSPAQWVLEAANACLNKEIDGIVTGPVSKKTFVDSGLPYLGHTPLLQKVSNSKSAYMGFLGKYFNVLLATGHIPILKVEENLSSKALDDVLEVALNWRRFLTSELRQKPIGVLGLNPHSGEGGMIGSFEQKVLYKKLSKFPDVVGPLVPDSAWGRENWNKFSFYVALYHDQGLIPFKMIHGHSGGAHVTLGIPFVRTSVDHGTAVDIAGKNLARPESMRDAIKWCEILVKNKR